MVPEPSFWVLEAEVRRSRRSARCVGYVGAMRSQKAALEQVGLLLNPEDIVSLVRR